jgi:hypothetical protein
VNTASVAIARDTQPNILQNNNDPDNRNNNLGFRVCRASHIFTRLLMAVCVVCGRRVQGVARFPCASKIMTWPRLGVAAQSV